MKPFNKRKTDYIIPLAYMISDMVALISAFVLAFVLRVTYSSRPPYYLIKFNSYFLIILSLIPIFIAIFYFSGLYKKEIIRKRFKETLLLVVASFTGVMVLI